MAAQLADRAPLATIEHRWDCYAAVAAALLKGREQGYPRLVEAGRLTEDEADRRIAIMAACAEIWRAASACTLPDPLIAHGHDRSDIVAELRRARAITAKLLAREPGNGAARYRVERIDTMIAWHVRWIEGPLFLVRITLELRARCAAPERHAA